MTSNDAQPISRIAVLGAGAIGCYLAAGWGPLLVEAGVALTLLGREQTLAFGQRGSLQLSGRHNARVSTDLFVRTTDSASLRSADLIILTTKATAIASAIEAIENYASPGTPIICLLNGVAPVRSLRERLPDYPVVAGMVPFNVVWKSASHLHRSSAGEIALENAPQTRWLAEQLTAAAVGIELHGNLQSLQYGKLLLNLVNPVNALSGLPLHAMLSQHGYRRIYSAVLSEALSVYRAARIDWAKVGPISPDMAVKLLLAPDWLFNRTLLKIQRIDSDSLTSMATDLQASRLTEINVINAEVVRMALAAGTVAPINDGLVSMVRQAEQSGRVESFSPDGLAEQLGL